MGWVEDDEKVIEERWGSICMDGPKKVSKQLFLQSFYDRDIHKSKLCLERMVCLSYV